MLVLLVVLTILALGTFAVGSYGVKLAKEIGEEYHVPKMKAIKFGGPAVCAILIVLSMLISGLCIVDSTEVGVVRTFGEINRQIDSGMNFVNPVTDTVTKYDLKVHKREESFASYTKDAQPLTGAIEYQYKLDPAAAMKVAQEYGSYEVLEGKIANVVQEKAKVVFAKYSAMTLLENRSTLSTEVAAEVESIEDLYHIKFTSVIVKDIDFSDAFEASVEAKMTAEQDALKAEQEKKTAIIKAEQEKEVAKLEAEALQITRQALQNMPKEYIESMWIEKWDGELPQIVTDGSNLMYTPELKNN